MRDILIQETLQKIFLRTLPIIDVGHEIASRLRSAIEIGLLKPGSRIKQQDLADICNVSRMPVREALRMLGVQGYLVHEIYKGYMVAPDLPSKPLKTNFNQLIMPIKTLYDLLESPEARAQFEMRIIKELRNL